MNGRPILTDALVDLMLARRAGHAAPVDLIDVIGAAVAETPQVRRPRWGPVAAPAPRAPALQPALVLALVGLLLAAALGAALIGGGLLRRSHEVSVPAPSDAPSPGTMFTVTASAFGPITWSTIDVPGEGTWWPVVGTPHGPLAAVERVVGDGHDDDLRWPGADGSWSRLELSHLVFRFLPTGDGVIVSALGEGVPPYWLRWSGSAWVIGEPVDVDGTMDVNDVAVGPRGVLLTDGSAVAVATDGRTFIRAAQPPAKTKLQPNATECAWPASGSVGEGHIGPMMVTDRGFVALTPADPADWVKDYTCEPVVWSSSDGSAWDLVSASSPFGSGAYVREVASRAGRHVAIGAVPPSPGDSANAVWNAVWVSEDGVAWERLSMPEPAGTCPLEEPLRCGHVYSRVVSGDAGWIILDYEGFAWTSVDGRTWQAAAGWPGIPAGWLPQGLALSPGSIVETNFGGRGLLGVFEPR